MDSIRVIYVEDNPADQELTLRHLSRHAPHLKVRIAPTVADAIEKLEFGDVDLVLSDFRLPDGTGLDVLKWSTRGISPCPWSSSRDPATPRWRCGSSRRARRTTW
jgi:CheY-like chemotaxis protein